MKTTLISRRLFCLAIAAMLSLGLITAPSAGEGDTGTPTPEPEKQPAFKGTLYVVGGAADTSLKRFVELAGGANAKIVILPHSSSVPVEAADAAANAFASLGAKSSVIIQPGGNQNLPKDMTAIWMTGGDQNRFMRLAPKTLIGDVAQFLKDGGVVGGSSAGAALVATRMIAGGMEDGFPRGSSLRLADGLGLLPGFVVDTHVKQRERHDRLMAALAMVSGVKGIGLDEDTAVEIHGNKGKVHGAGCARLYERGPGFKSDLNSAKDQAKTSVRKMLYSVVPAGEEFDLCK